MCDSSRPAERDCYLNTYDYDSFVGPDYGSINLTSDKYESLGRFKAHNIYKDLWAFEVVDKPGFHMEMNLSKQAHVLNRKPTSNDSSMLMNI